MNILQLVRLVFSDAPRRFSIAIFLLLVAAGCELLGLASLLPVATELFQHGELHAGIASTILGLLGVKVFTIDLFLLLVVCTICLRGVVVFFAYDQIAKVSTALEEGLTSRAIDGIVRAKWRFIHDLGTARVIDATTRQASETGAIVTLLAPCMTGLILSSVFTAAVAYFSPFSLLFAALIGIPLFIFLRGVRRSSLSAMSSLSPLNERKSKEVIEAIQNAKYVKVAGIEHAVIRRIQILLSEIRTKQMRLQRSNAMMAAGPDTLVVVGVAALIGLIHAFSLDSGTNFLLALMLMYRAFHYFNQTQGTIQQIRHLMPSPQGLSELAVRAELEREVPAEYDNENLRFEREVAFENVSFSYDSTSVVLKGVSFVLKKNHFLAIRGRSGAGKTTLIDLLVGLREPQSGRVCVDGRTLTPQLYDSWRSKIAYIPQEPPLFQGTIRDNLQRDNAAKTDEELIDAIKLSCVEEILDRAGGLDAHIGERGLLLSGGQRQRILIARALLRDVELMILDEPTSAVDPAAETLLFTRLLSHIKSKKTIVVVMHREGVKLNNDEVLNLS